MRLIHVSIYAALALSPCAHADCSAQGGALRPQLLELYTSEGCNSCPPAEDWLNRMQAGALVVPLAFHVDYWDSARWKDRFAQPGFAARQRSIAMRSKNQIYTPQVVLDGEIWSNWHRGSPIAARAAATGAFAMQVRRSDLQVQWQTQFTGAAGTDDYKVFVALVEDGLQSQVRAGENSGKSLRHDHVVRAFNGPHPAVNGSVRLRARSKVDLDRARIIAWMQDVRTGAVGQVLQVTMSDCEASPR